MPAAHTLRQQTQQSTKYTSNKHNKRFGPIQERGWSRGSHVGVAARSQTQDPVSKLARIGACVVALDKAQSTNLSSAMVDDT